MVQLTLDPGQLTAIDKIPVAPCTAVIAPVGQRGHVGKDGIEGRLCLVGITKVGCPHVYLFLAGGVPWHLTPKRIVECLPVISS